MRLALRTRLTVWFAASILLILTPFLIGVLTLQWRSMRAALDHHLTEDLEVAIQMLAIDGSRVAWRAAGARDPGYDAGPQRWVEVYSGTGEVLFLRGIPTDEAIRSSIEVPTPAASGFRTLQTPAGAYVRTRTVSRRLESIDVLIRVARSEDDLRLELTGLVVLFSLAAPLAVVTAAVAGYVISGRALQPLTVMAERARSISAERLSERLPMENPDDELGRLAVVFNDTFARLEASFERLKQFTADASHELRTPLQAIRSVGEVGLQHERDPAEYQEIIGSMLEEADRLARVVDTLLTLSRWEAGRLRPSPQAVDLRALVLDVVQQLAVLAEDRDVTIAVELDEPLAVSADPVMVRQAATNVIDNAIKFTRPGTRVRVSSRAEGGEHHLVIDDEGPGIPVEERERVLQRFYRIDSRHTRAAAGAGLGLAIVHRAMVANAGRVVIDGSPAGGARVELVLPRSPAA